MKYIRVFTIVLLVGLLSLPHDVLACENFKAEVDAAEQAVDEAEKRLDVFEKKAWLMLQTFKIGGNVWDLDPDDEHSAGEAPVQGDILGQAKHQQKIMEANEKTLRDAENAVSSAKSALASAQADYDNCVELTNKVNNVKVKLPCGIHEEGTPGNHKKVLCPTDSGRKCEYESYYACTPHTHAYSGSGSGSSRKSASATLTPSSGSSRGTAGKVYGLVLKTTSAFREVSWYVASPGDSGRGTYLGKVRGSSSSFTTSIGHSFSRRSVSGDYVFTASVRDASDGSVYEVSYTVRIGSSSDSETSTPEKPPPEKPPVVKKEVSPPVTPVEPPDPDADTDEKRDPPVKPPVSDEKQEPPPKVPPKAPSKVPPKDTSKDTSDPQTADPKSPEGVKCANTNRGSGACSYGRVVSGTNTLEHLTTCPAGHKYWSCNASAVSSHASHTAPTTNTNNNNNNGNPNNGNNNGNTKTPTAPKKPTTTTATMQSCGHVYDPDSSSAYSHRVITCPTKNGVKCIHRSYYACQSSTHTHEYREKPTKTTTVRCANNYQGSGACSYGRVVSGTDAYEHRATCAAGHTYWSCNATAVASHKAHKAPTTNTNTGNSNNNGNSNSNNGNSNSNNNGNNNGGNSNSNNNGGNTPPPKKPDPPPPPPKKPDPPPPPPPKKPDPPKKPTSSGNSSSGNNSSGNNSSGNSSSGNSSSGNNSSGNNSSSSRIVCPANAWTGCGGTSSHATTCGKGHTYYTCNSNAVRYHSRH